MVEPTLFMMIFEAISFVRYQYLTDSASYTRWPKYNKVPVVSRLDNSAMTHSLELNWAIIIS